MGVQPDKPAPIQDQGYCIDAGGTWPEIDGRGLANYILDFCDSQHRAVTNLALQKIIYFCHVWALLEFDKPLVKQEFEAWEYGPVLQYVYREFKHAASSPISNRAKKIDLATGLPSVVLLNPPKELEQFLKKVLNFYTRLSASQLVNLSHVQNGPWDKAWHHDGKTNPGMRISNRDIKKFYSVAPEALENQ
jgi:uncharacterized phage-associated protein